jgi:hypothetical protein
MDFFLMVGTAHAVAISCFRFSIFYWGGIFPVFIRVGEAHLTVTAVFIHAEA